MWSSALGSLRRLILLSDQVSRNTEAIESLNRKVTDLALIVENLSLKIDRNEERERHEREKLALRLENILLRFERRLPPREDPD
jgi:hypothetical protein